MSPVIRRAFVILVVCAVAAGAGYYWYVRPQAPAAAQTPAAAPPPEVGIVVVQQAEVPFPVEYAGRVAGFRDVEIRPLVSGLLLRREYEEGARVKQGQVLFRIDPATYQVALSRAEAQLQQAQATLRQAEENFKRIEELSRRQVATERQLDEAIAARAQARASIQLAEAEINAAKLNLGYTVVNAPVSGVTALESPPVGTLIQAQQTVLTRITQLDPAYVNFSFTDEEGQAFRALNEKRAKPISEKDLTVELHYANGTVYPQQGRIDTAAQRIAVQTGTIQARAIFPNADGALLPGQFVRVKVHGVTLPDAIVIPSRAVSQGPQGPSVFVVGDNNIAEARPLRLGAELAQGWVVREGLKGGERIIVDGIIRVRPGAPVRPVPLATTTATTQTPTPAGGQSAGPRP
jgi:membrane fusion protein (multidrug efflux system)